MKKQILSEEFRRMQSLAGIKVDEIKVNKPSPLNYLLDLQSKIEATDDNIEKASLAIQCAEKVLYIYEEKYPNYKGFHKAIEAAKKYLANPTKENEKASIAATNDDMNYDYSTSIDEAYDWAAYAVGYATYAANNISSTYTSNADDAATAAINAVKKHYNLNEIKVNKPSPLNYLLNLKSKIEASNDLKEKISLAIQCAERVLFIFEEEYPDDKRPRQAIEAAKKCLAFPTEDNKNAVKKADNRVIDAYSDVFAMNGEGDITNATSAAGYTSSATIQWAAFEDEDAGYYADYAADYAIDAADYAIEAVKEYYNIKLKS